MRVSLLAAFLIAGLCACNRAPPLTDAQKAKYMYELVDDAHSCDGYRTRLSTPGIEGAAIDALYREAIRAGCIKRDV